MRKWLARFAAHRLEGLVDKSRSGPAADPRPGCRSPRSPRMAPTRTTHDYAGGAGAGGCGRSLPYVRGDAGRPGLDSRGPSKDQWPMLRHIAARRSSALLISRRAQDPGLLTNCLLCTGRLQPTPSCTQRRPNELGYRRMTKKRATERTPRPWWLTWLRLHSSLGGVREASLLQPRSQPFAFAV
ncbi:hypothetical protein [Streptomyces ferrugineus]|uniref:hypothetical protein n=1 Tax=Streptomyces ferrugineus TaxID=1413221 RepID=UPI00389AD8C0